MEIDEEKQYGLYKIEKNAATNEIKRFTHITTPYLLILIMKQQLKNKSQRK